VEQNDSMTVSN